MHAGEKTGPKRQGRKTGPKGRGNWALFHIGDVDTSQAVDYLWEAGILVRNTDEKNGAPLSAGFYSARQGVDVALGPIYEFMMR